uniref:MOSC domain-containing protein n=2 Tax=Bursaphelenchus xylophilus TaxID=6326 RepID=A0A1I7SKP4_BURXY
QNCDDTSIYCNNEKKVSIGCPGTFGQKTLDVSSDKTRQHYVPMANPKILFAQGRKYVRAAELVVRCPTCERNDEKYIRNGDSSKVFKMISFVREGFPAHRSCSPFERDNRTGAGGIVFDDEKIASIAEYERKMGCLYGLECRDLLPDLFNDFGEILESLWE